MRIQAWQHGASGDVGDRSTLVIIAAFHESGYGIYLPFGENTRCDLIAELGGTLTRVQCE